VSEDSITRYEFNLLKESIEERLSKVDNSLLAIWGKIDKRLPWSVLVIVSFLSSLVVGLLVALLK